MNPWLKIMRPVNGIMGIVATIISGFIGVGFNLPSHLYAILAASVSVFLVTSGGNVINDLVDVETDRVNHPQRPLVTGKISKEAAKAAFVMFFAVAAIVSGVFISIYALALVLLAEVFLGLYETKTKKMGLAGNVMISILVGLIFIFGGIAVNSIGKMLLLFAMAALASLSREIIKDIEDMGGDVDRTTLPKSIGVRGAAAVAITAIAIAVSFSYLPYYLGIFKLYYLAIVAVSDILFIVSAVTIIRNPGISQQVSKLAMIVGLFSFAVGGII